MNPGDPLIGKSFYILSRKIYLGISAGIREPELKRYFYALLILDDATGPVTQTDFALAFGTDKANTVRIIDLLSEKKYLQRKECKMDRRRHHLELTSKGKRKVVEIRKAAEEIHDLSLKGFSKKDKEAFAGFIEKIYSNLEKVKTEIV